MNIFEYTDYKIYFNDWVSALPKAGRGEYRRLSQKLNISTTMVSQVFNGDKHLNLELASDICDYLQLDEQSTEYFFLLVEYARAGSYRLQQKLLKRIKFRQSEAKKLATRLQADKELSDEKRALYYSSWIYSGIRNLCAIPNVNDVDKIAERLQIPRNLVQKILDFLKNEGLVIQTGNTLEVGPRRTHIGADSPLVVKHHQNWRIHGFEKMQLSDPENLFYTAPMSLSDEVAKKIREELPSFIEKLNKWIVPSPSEVVRCLNIDWYEY